MEFAIGSLVVIVLLALAALVLRPEQFKPYPPIVRLGAHVGLDQEILIDAHAVRERVRGPEQIKFDSTYDYLRKYAGYKNFIFVSASLDHQDWGNGFGTVWVVRLRPLSPVLRFVNVLRGYSVS